MTRPEDQCVHNGIGGQLGGNAAHTIMASVSTYQSV